MAKGLLGSVWSKLIGVGVAALLAVLLIMAMRSLRAGGNEVLAAAPMAAAPGATSSKGGGPTIGGCPVFPADNVWNTRVDKLKVDPRSNDYVTSIGPEKPLHPDFGPDPRNGIPFSLIHFNQKRVKVTFEYRDDSDLGNYPIPPDAKIEGGRESSPQSDRHIILIDTDRCELYEIYQAIPQPDGTWKAGAGIQMDLTSNALRDEGKTSGDAAGLPIFPGLVRYDEVASGEIRHAIRFTVPKTQRAYIWPGRHFASKITDPHYPPMGARFRLKADVDISSYSKTDQVILTALKQYGMILADNGSPWFITGVPDPHWNMDDLSRMKALKGADFEAVDESGFLYMENSARVDPMLPR